MCMKYKRRPYIRNESAVAFCRALEHLAILHDFVCCVVDVRERPVRFLLGLYVSLEQGTVQGSLYQDTTWGKRAEEDTLEHV